MPLLFRFSEGDGGLLRSVDDHPGILLITQGTDASVSMHIDGGMEIPKHVREASGQKVFSPATPSVEGLHVVSIEEAVAACATDRELAEISMVARNLVLAAAARCGFAFESLAGMTSWAIDVRDAVTAEHDRREGLAA